MAHLKSQSEIGLKASPEPRGGAKTSQTPQGIGKRLNNANLALTVGFISNMSLISMVASFIFAPHAVIWFAITVILAESVSTLFNPEHQRRLK